MPTIDHPPLDEVLALVRALESQGITVAVGGSAILASLGLVAEVHDWDVTVDADSRLVREAVTAAGLTVASSTPADGVFATRERLSIDAPGHTIDLLNGFAARDGDAVVDFPVRVSGRWLGLPIGDPDVWASAYRLIGRLERARVLEEWLERRSLLG